MNELLKRLSLEAGGSHYPNINPELQKKFAELIILECDRYARSAWEHGELLGGDLKRHFGFEP
jgi:hypothetical protein